MARPQAARQQDATQDGTDHRAQIGKLLNDFDNHRCGYQVNFCIQLMWGGHWRVPAKRQKRNGLNSISMPRFWTIPARRARSPP